MTGHVRTRALLGIGLAALLSAAAAPGGGAEYVAIRAGRVLIGNGEEKTNVTILLEDGKVKAVGENVELPFPCRRIDASAATVMPGLIHAHSRLGLLDYNRSGQQANLKVADEFLPAPDAFDDAIAAGFTTLGLTAPGSGMPGLGMVIRTFDSGAGLVVDDLSFLKMTLQRPGGDRTLIAGALKGAKEHLEKVKKAREEWEKKKAEFDAKKAEEAKKKEAEKKEGTPAPAPSPSPPGKSAEEPPKPEPKPADEKFPDFQPPAAPDNLKPVIDLIEKKEGVFALIEVGGAATWLHWLEAIKGFEFPYVAYCPLSRGGFGAAADLFLAAKEIAEKKALVGLSPLITYFPSSINRVSIPRILVEAGARVAFVPASDRKDDLDAIRYQVAELIEGGLSREVALKGLGVHAAELLGLQSRLGSLEPGKDGNLLILSGDPFDVQTRVEKVIVEGAVAYDRAKAEAER